jgi:hypothetical protein
VYFSKKTKKCIKVAKTNPHRLVKIEESLVSEKFTNIALFELGSKVVTVMTRIRRLVFCLSSLIFFHLLAPLISYDVLLSFE